MGLPDEQTGSNEQELELKQLNARLLLSTQDLSGYELLPIAQVKRASAGAARPQLDESYIPPVIAIDAWQGLGRDIVRAIYDIIGQKIEVLSQQIASRNIGLDSRNPGDLDRILMLGQLNAASSTLSIMGFAQGTHPLTAYTELCRICGQLSIFGKDRRAEPVPPYDHDNLAGIFKEIYLRIERLLNAVRDYEYEQRAFIGVGLGMQVTLEPKWFNSDWQWYIGVNKGDLTTQECQELLSSGGARLEARQQPAGGDPVQAASSGRGDAAAGPADPGPAVAVGLAVLRSQQERRTGLARRASDADAGHAAAGLADHQPRPAARQAAARDQQPRAELSAAVCPVRGANAGVESVGYASA